MSLSHKLKRMIFFPRPLVFESVTDWVAGGHEGRFSRDPRPVFSAIPVRAGMSTLWCCPFSISSADHGIAHLLRCPEGWFWRGCCRDCHTRIVTVSNSWQLPEEVPVDPKGSWSCSAPNCWSFTSSRRCQEVSSGIWFRKPFFSQQVRSMFHSHRGGWRWRETCRAWTCLRSW